MRDDRARKGGCCLVCGWPLAAGGLVQDMDSGLVVNGGRAVYLPPREMDVLMVLHQGMPRVVPKERLAKRVFGLKYYDLSSPKDLMQTHICKMRGKLDPIGVRIRTRGWYGCWLEIEG